MERYGRTGKRGIAALLAVAVVVLAMASGTSAAFSAGSVTQTTPLIIPQPQELTWRADWFRVDRKTRIVTNAAPDSRDIFTAEQLRRKVWDTTAVWLQIVRGKPGAPTKNVIAIGSTAKNAAVASIINSWPTASGTKPKSEGYLLGIRGDSVVIRGFDQAGTFYGCQTLIQLLEQKGPSPLPGLFCYDYPDLPWRGTMVRIWGNMDVDFTRELISEVMARFKLNKLLIDLEYGVIWPSHPELYWGLPPDERPLKPCNFKMITKVADCARQCFMEVIPESAYWSHSEATISAWKLNGNLREDRSEADPAQGVESLCPRNPKAQALVHDIWNDIIKSLKPTHMHLGWDELSAIGSKSCPNCKGASKTALFKEFLERDRDYLIARGVQPLMWADMLRADMNGGVPWRLADAATTTPKDIILCDWEYKESRDNSASARNWNVRGLQWLASPYGGYKPYEENIFNWARIAREHKGKGLLAFNKFRCGDKKATLANPLQLREMECMVFYGEYAWNAPEAGAKWPGSTPYDGFEVVRRQLSHD